MIKPNRTVTNARGGYDARYMPLLRAVEDSHFWFRARNRVIGSLVRQLEAGFQPGYRVLEVGCGTGNTLRVLTSTCTRGVVFGMDVHREGLMLAKERVRCPLLQADISAAPFGSGVRFNMVAMFDVLEHIFDDRSTLTAVRSWMAPGGFLLLTVPAGPRLWSAVDVAAGHCRRYSARQLKGLLETTGFNVAYLSPMMASLYPILWVARNISPLRHEQHDPAAAELRVVPLLNEMMLAFLSAEARFIDRRRVLPFGTSLVAIARAESHATD